MFNFVQFSTDKRERWTLVAAKQPLKKPAAFRTVLAVSHNPDDVRSQGADPDEAIKYIGPMYFDLDGADINAVLGSAKNLISDLRSRYGVPFESMQCYLSGKKGVHITFSEALFGIKSPQLLLPAMYGKFADQFPYEHIDRSVYSSGKGRMWRCENVQRPDSGTYKVAVTAEEMMDLDADSYAELVKHPRPPLVYNEPDYALPELVSFLKVARDLVRKERAERKKMEVVVTNDDLRNAEGIPGCIDILITQGDCPESNWNQAAMQLACYIAARYERSEEEEYTADLIDPFVINVSSSSRPSENERRTEVGHQLHRAWSGQLKFSVGGIIATIGKPCGNCVICSRKSEDGAPVNEEGEYYDEATKIHFTKTSVTVMTENGSRILLTAPLKPVEEFRTLDDFGQEVVETTHFATIESKIVSINEDALRDKKQFSAAFKGMGVYFKGSDADLTNLAIAIESYKVANDMQSVIRAPMCGIQFQERDGRVIPHLVARNNSYTKNGVPSPYVFSGKKEHAPCYENVPSFTDSDDVKGLEKAMLALIDMNEPEVLLPALGWFVASHLKTHLTHTDKSYPMLNVCGGSHSGKSSTVHLLQTLNAFKFKKAPTWNAETSTIYPLEELISSSYTVVRIIEEANEAHAKRKWAQLVGILKSSWDAEGIMKGGVVNRRLQTRTLPNDAPLVYMSEQSFPIQSIRTRSIVCHFSPTALENKEYSTNHRIAVENVQYLEMLAKVLVTVALNIDMSVVKEWREEAYADLPDTYTGRTQIAYGVVLVGLKFLTEVMKTYSEIVAITLKDRYNWLLTHLSGESDSLLKAKRQSATDDILSSLDLMAAEPDNIQHGLESGRQYWLQGSMLHLDLRQCFPRFRRYLRGVGLDGSLSITSVQQWQELLEREPYFEQVVPHPSRAGVTIHVVNLDKLEAKGTALSNFIQGEPL